MSKRNPFHLLALAVVLMSPVVVLAGPQSTPKQDLGPIKATDTKKEEPKKEEVKKDPATEDYEKAIKGLPKFEGPFTLFQRKKEILLELPEAAIGKQFMMQATLHTGISGMGGQAGDPVGSGPVAIFQFERHDDVLWVVRPNTKYRWDDKDPLAEASKRTFPTAILEDCRIEQKDPARKVVLVNITDLFTSNLWEIQEMVSSAAGGAYMADREKSSIEKIKSFGENTIVRYNFHYMALKGGGSSASALLELLGLASKSHLEDSRSAPISVTYNMWYRKADGYMPRLSDPRIGFFTQDFFAVSRFDEIDRTKRYIVRWPLKKKDPNALVSEPVEPITWYVDSSVPEKFRSAVKRGILYWNAAFDEIGYKNAVVVKDAPKDDPDWDHADGRYNVIRWTMTESMAYAVALFRNDPLTGKIYNAAVTVDANYPSSILQEFRTTTQAGTYPVDAGMSALLRGANGEPNPLPVSEQTARKEAFRKKMGEKGWQLADMEFAQGMGEEMANGWGMLKAVGAKVDEDAYMQAAVEDLVAHEVGHCFGLRHNFAGSTNLTTQQLLDDDLVRKEGISASVMDYNAVNVMAVLRGSGVFFNPCIGPYDKWAIRYGYGDVVANSPEGEQYALGLIARESGKPGHLYLTDEDADGLNPLAVRFDGAKDSVNFTAKQLEGTRRLRWWAIKKLAKPGESYFMRNSIVLGTMMQTFSHVTNALRYVGGIEYRRSHKLDIGEMPTLKPVDAQTQREAMRLIRDACLSVDAVDIPEDVLLSLNLDENGERGSNWNAPLRRLMTVNLTSLLSQLMSAKLSDQIAENEFKLKGRKDRYTVAEHYGIVMASVFKEIGAGKPVNALRRDLQRYAVEGLILQASAKAGSVSEDVRTIASQTLKRLDVRIRKAIAEDTRLDSMTKMHLSEMSDRIERYRGRQVVSDR